MKGLIGELVLTAACTAFAAVLSCGLLPAAWAGDGCAGCGAGCAGGWCPGPSPTAQQLSGCSNKLYDRCWPDRFTNLADREVNRALTPQVINGHVLDQTVWNHYFEPGTDRLTPGGIAALQYISRRRPHPDTTIYLAAAMDLPYDPGCPDRYCGARQELDQLRAAAIQKFLVGLNCGRPTDYHVCVHDPSDVTISTVPVGSSVLQMYGRYRGGLLTGAGGSGGAAGPSGSGTANVGGIGGR
jgi:hypothetical protein